MNKFYNPVRTFQGYGSLAQLPALAKEAAESGKKILLLVWNKQVLSHPHLQAFQNDSSLSVITEEFTASNPEISQLWQMYEKTKDMNIGLVAAVGGGSVMDVGKSLCCLYHQDIADEEALRRMIADKSYGNPVCRWIGIPTTAGTGSEVTCWATIWDSANNKKYSVDTQRNYAYAAVVDPQLACTMPIKLAVSSALDAAAHATESYWAKASNTVSRALALEAIRIIMGNINLLFDEDTLHEGHDQMAKGSMLAGLAFSNTRTTACHSISYPLTMHCHIPHGTAVSMLLGSVMKLNQRAIPDLPLLLRAYGVNSIDEVGERITALLTKAGYPASLRGWGADESLIPFLAAHSITKGRADNNPVEITEAVVTDILKGIF